MVSVLVYPLLAMRLAAPAGTHERSEEVEHAADAY
jgi:hypothetical protein